MPIDIEHDDIPTALKKLKTREDLIKSLESVSGLGSWEVDLATKKAIWSDRSYEIYGIDKSTHVSIDLFFSLLIEEDIPLVQTELEKLMTSNKPTSVECRVRHSSGKIITLLINAKVLFKDDGTPEKLLGTTQDITSYVELKERDRELSSLLEHSSNEIYIVHYDTLDYLYVNNGVIEALQYTKDELLQMNVRDINPFLDENKIKKLKNKLKHTRYILNRSIHQRKDSSQYYVQSYIHTLSYQGKEAFVIFDTDITQIIELEKKYKKQASILEHIHDSIIATDANGKITSWNHGSTNLLGYTPQEIIGTDIVTLYDKSNDYKLEEIFKILRQDSKLNIEAYMIRKDTHQVICDISLSILRDQGNVEGYIGYLKDVSKEKETQKLLDEQTKKLQHQAHHDTLTDLPNRTLFKDRLSQSIIFAKRHKEKFALLFIDLDQFKKINDSLGHDMGDKVLIEAAKRLKSSIREEDTLSRLGGDEFTIIVKDVKNVRAASVVAQKIVDTMKEAIIIDKHHLYVTSSIGISTYPDDALNEENLIKYADVAMYKAKDEGRDNYQFYSADMTALAFERVVMESSLRVAIKEKQFIVYFQPQFEIDNEKIIGMEALVRWIHPTLGLVPPGKFIPIAEESGLIVEIDRIVMKKAMKQFTQWYKEGYNPGILALNLAMKQLSENDFLLNLRKTMQEIGFQPQWLELEVTEGQVMNNPEGSIKKLHKLSEMGIEIAIDDFGTGYSSLSYLKKLPLDKLKIDQSFVKDIPEDEDDMAITKAIIALGKSLNLKLIAEGVETEAQKKFLLENGCKFVQGYLFSKPLPIEEISLLLQTRKI